MDAVNSPEAVQRAIETGVTLVSNWGLQVVGAIALFLVGRMVAGMVRKGARRALEKGKVDASLIPFFSNMAFYLVIVVVVIAALQLFGIETTSLVAVVGATGLAIGLALQGTLSNFAAGVMLIVFRPFKNGDYVEVGGAAGSVAELGLFSTTLNTPDNVRVTIPNASVYGETIKNYSANATRRIDLVIGVSYGDEIDKAMSIMREVVSQDERVLADPAPTIAVLELGDSSVNFVVRPWVNGTDYWPTRFDLTKNIKLALEAGGCSIPFPQRDLHVIDMPSAKAS